jgi:molybdenum cofactor cytidylyltransferase
MIIGLILAAGKGSRMGQNKMLAKLKGKPLLHHVCDVAEASHLDKIIIVTGFEAEKLQASMHKRDKHLPLYGVGEGLTFVYNPQFEDGLSTSLRTGLTAILKHYPEAKAAMVLLGDMPFVSPVLINQLLAAFTQETDIIVPSFQGELGNPVLWGRAHFPKLLALEGDKGARNLLKTLPFRTLVVDEAAIHLDVDTPEALHAFQKT